MEALKETTMNIILEDTIKFIPPFSKYIKEGCTSHRRPIRMKLYKNIIYIMLNEISKKIKITVQP